MPKARKGTNCAKIAAVDEAMIEIPYEFRRPKYAELSLYQYTNALEEQGNVCAICEGIGKCGLVRDHNHRTEAFRAFLCRRCNFIVGLLETHPDLNGFFRYINSDYQDPDDEWLEWVRIIKNDSNIIRRIEKAGLEAAQFFDYLKRDHQDEKQEWWEWVSYCERKS